MGNQEIVIWKASIALFIRKCVENVMKKFRVFLEAVNAHVQFILKIWFENPLRLKHSFVCHKDENFSFFLLRRMKTNAIRAFVKFFDVDINNYFLCTYLWLMRTLFKKKKKKNTWEINRLRIMQHVSVLSKLVFVSIRETW